MIELRQHQQQAVDDIYGAWRDGCRNLLYVLPTGAGKTYVEAALAREFSSRNQMTIIIAHRDVLCCQISESLAALGVRHNILAAKATIRFTADQHVHKFKRSFYDTKSSVIVASAQTLATLTPAPWMQSIALWIVDEAHHVLRENQWGRCVDMFPNALGLGMTATPIRGDKKGLGVMADGVFNLLMEGPTLRDLIDAGYLCDYVIKLPPSSAILKHAFDNVRVTPSGDYSPSESKEILDKAAIYGDVVGAYLQFVGMQPGLTFGQDIDHCEKLAQAYRDAGVSAEALSSKTPHAHRLAATNDFKRGKLMQLTNCDLFGEGYDAPACMSVSMVRRTLSYAVFSQQFGRVLRTSLNKTHGTVLDFVGNIYTHGLPDYGLDWTLDAPKKRAKSNTDSKAQRFTRCENPNCFGLILLPASECDHCGHPILAATRVTRVIDGELVAMDDALAAALRGKAKKVFIPAAQIQQGLISNGSPPALAKLIAKNHAERQDVHNELRRELTRFYNHCQSRGFDVAQSLQLFAMEFKTDVLTAQTLSKNAAQNLLERLQLFNSTNAANNEE